MKTTYFTWAWKNTPAQPDKLMTRARMARMMRAWRRSRTQGKQDFTFYLVSRDGKSRTYKVVAATYPDECATFTIASVPAWP